MVMILEVSPSPRNYMHIYFCTDPWIMFTDNAFLSEMHSRQRKVFGVYGGGV